MYSSYLKYGHGPIIQNVISNSIKNKNQTNKHHCDCLNCLINCAQYKFILQTIQDKNNVKNNKKKIFFISDKDNIPSPLFFYETPSNEIIDLIQSKNISENFLSISQKINSENDIINNYDQNKKNKILLFNYLKFPLININSENNINKQSTIIILDDGKYEEISNYSIKSYSIFNKNYSLLFDIHNLKKADFIFTLDDIKDCEEIIFNFNGDIHGHKLFKNDAICSLNPSFIINSIKTRMEKFLNFNLNDKEVITNLYNKFFFAKINDENRNNIGILFSFNNTKDINKIKIDKDYILKENYRIIKLFICIDMWINNNNIETKDTSKPISIISKTSNPKQEVQKKNYVNDNNNNTDYNYINNNVNNNYRTNYTNNNFINNNANNNYMNNNYMNYNYNYFPNSNNEYNNIYSEYNNNYTDYNNNFTDYNNNYTGYNNNYTDYNDYYNEYNNSYSHYNYNESNNNNTYYNNYNKSYENDKYSSSFTNYENKNNNSFKQSSIVEDVNYSSNNKTIFENKNNYNSKNIYNNKYKNNFENKEYLENFSIEKYYELNTLFKKLDNSENNEIVNKSNFSKEETTKDIKIENENYNKSLFLDINKKLMKELFSKYKQDNCISNYTILKSRLDINMNIKKEKLNKIKLKYFYYCFKDIYKLTMNIPYLNKRGKLFLNEFYPTLSSMRLILNINNKKTINKLRRQKKENFNIKKIKQNILKIEYQEIKPSYERDLLYNKINDIIQILGENKLTFKNVLIDKSFLCILWSPTNNIITNSSFLAYYSFDLKLIGILIIKLNSFQLFSSFSNDINNFKDYKKEYDKNVENIKIFFKNLSIDKEDGYYKNFVSDDYMQYIKSSTG